MDLKIVMLLFVVLVAIISTTDAVKHKKVVIHVPLKVKKHKHTHTVYKTIHHHHKVHHKSHPHHHYGGIGRKGHQLVEEHEHFHHNGDLFGHHSVLHPKLAKPDLARIAPAITEGRR